MTVPPISAGFDPEPLLIESWRHFDKPKSAIWTGRQRTLKLCGHGKTLLKLNMNRISVMGLIIGKSCQNNRSCPLMKKYIIGYLYGEKTD